MFRTMHWLLLSLALIVCSCDKSDEVSRAESKLWLEQFEQAKLESARLQLRQLGMALDLYYVMYGEYPETLELLVQAPDASKRLLERLDDDPWGSPFRYERRPKSIRLSSVGPDKLVGTNDDLHLEELDELE